MAACVEATPKARQNVKREAVSEAIQKSTSTAATVDRNLKRQRCSLDFDTLDCPICLESLFPPVYQCQNGHTACARCCNLLEKGTCPSCTLPMGNNRCNAVEKIIESLRVSCKYADWGCKEMLRYSRKRDEHEALCKFRPFRCPVLGCLHEGLKSSLRQHFLLDHNLAEVKQSSENGVPDYDIKFLTRESAYDESHSQYALIQAFEYDDEESDDSNDGSLFLVHLQFQKKFCWYSFSCSSFGATRQYVGYGLVVKNQSPEAFREKHSVDGPIFYNQKDQARLSKGVRQGDFFRVPKLNSQANDCHLLVKLSLMGEQDYESDF